jgi:nucleoside phosphorylase
MKKPILLVGAMEKELSGIIDYYKCQPLATLQQTYPLYQAKNAPLFVLHTHVGDTNAAIATTLALKEIEPHVVLKIGCVGGNSAGIHTGDYILPITYFHSSS